MNGSFAVLEFEPMKTVKNDGASQIAYNFGEPASDRPIDPATVREISQQKSEPSCG